MYTRTATDKFPSVIRPFQGPNVFHIALVFITSICLPEEQIKLIFSLPFLPQDQVPLH